jgi:hypothetical protein
MAELARTDGRRALGPMEDSETPMLLTRDVEQLKSNLNINGGDFAVTVPIEELVGLLQPFNTRARHVLVSLLRGYSRDMAATAIGMTHEGLRGWGKRHPEFAEAMTKASQMGFSKVFEGELYRRALAGPDDRGSMRALELVAKSRSSAYRDKSQHQVDVIHHAQAATEQAFGGEWVNET